MNFGQIEVEETPCVAAIDRRCVWLDGVLYVPDNSDPLLGDELRKLLEHEGP